MARKAFCARLETLERRENLTASTGLHAFASAAIPLKGSGTGQVTSETTLPSRLALTATLIGNDARAGAFTGQVNGQIFLGKPMSSATGMATLAVASGATVNLSLTGSVHMKTRSSLATGTFKFHVTSGTGLLSGATGSGTGSGTINEASGAVTFKYQGRGRL